MLWALNMDSKKPYIAYYIGNFVLYYRNIVVFHMLCGFFYIHEFIHLQTIGLRHPINYKNNTSL
jgi:hypothetical protein